MWSGNDRSLSRMKMKDIQGSNEITALSSKARNDRGIKTNNVYLQMGKMCKPCGKIPS